LDYHKGKAYVKGYEIAKIGTTYVDVDRQEILIQIQVLLQI